MGTGAAGTGWGLRAALGAFAVLASWASPAPARVLLTQEEALARAFPGARVERTTEFLEEDQVRRVGELAGGEPVTRVITRYRGTVEGRWVGTAYFDAHRVRTLPETLMVVVGTGGEIRRVEVLSFDEPPDYLPRPRWFEQFQGKALDDDLALKRGLRGVTGATLSSQAVAAAVRRVLAIHQVLEAAAPPAAPAPGEERP